jgi:microcystin degradation protein MlrC
LAAAAGRGVVSPGVTRVAVPMLTAAEAHDTNTGALAGHMRWLQEAITERHLLDGSIFACQPWLDTARSTWTVTVTGDLARPTGSLGAGQMAEATKQRLLGAIDSFYVSKTPVEEIWAAVDALPAGTVVVSDSGDSPSAGATGDSIDCLRVLHAPGRPNVLATVTDAEAVEAARYAGVGAEVTVDVGGRLTPGLGAHLRITGTVLDLPDGRYTQVYPATPVDIGPCAVVRTANVDLVITSRPAFMLDTTLFEHLGIEPRAYRAVQVKSAGGFRALWAPVSTTAVVADSLGASTSRLTSLPFKKLPSGLWPFAQPAAT